MKILDQLNDDNFKSKIGIGLVACGVVAYLIAWLPDFATTLYWKVIIMYMSSLIAICVIVLNFGYYRQNIQKNIFWLMLFIFMLAGAVYLNTNPPFGLMGEHPQHLGLFNLLTVIPVSLVLAPVLKDTKTVYILLIILAIISLVTGLIDSGKLRLIGVGSNSNLTAMIMVIGLIFGWACKDNMNKWLYYSSSIIFLSTLALTQSRLGILVAIIFIVIAVMKSRKPIIIFISSFMLFLLLVINTRLRLFNYLVESVLYRLELLLVGLKLTIISPFGLGPGGISSNIKQFLGEQSLVIRTTPEFMLIDSTHNLFLDISIEWGVVFGLILIITCSVLVVYIIINRSQFAANEKPIVYSFLAMLIFVSFNNTTLTSWLLVTILLMSLYLGSFFKHKHCNN